MVQLLRSVIIPAYNESGRIGRLLNTLSDTGTEFIFVCDGTDQTADIIDRFAAEHPDMTIRCLRFNSRMGKGGGVLTGFRAATTPVVCFIDADNSTEYSALLGLIRKMEEGWDGVIGSRYLVSSAIERSQPFLRRIQSRGFNLIVRILFRLPYADTQCGAKVFRREAIETVLPRMRSRGFEFDVELLWHLKQAGYRICEEAVVWNDADDSRLRASDSTSMLTTLLKLRFGLL